MDSKNLQGIVGLVVVTLLSFGIILGTRALTGENGSDRDVREEEENISTVDKEMDVSGKSGIEGAKHLGDGGYETLVRAKGYGGDIIMRVNFAEDARTVEGVAVLEQEETEGVGSRITEEEFLKQFQGIRAPVQLSGDFKDGGNGAAKNEDEDLKKLENAVWKDGIYEAQGEKDADSGFTDKVSITVENGKIVEAAWDAAAEDGSSKAQLSQAGEYVMTEDGPTWKEQAETLAAVLIENQTLSAISTDGNGKTDAVSGVSISVQPFLNLAGQCLREAAGMDMNGGQGTDSAKEQEASQIDAITGATISSAAAADGINLAYEYLQEETK